MVSFNVTVTTREIKFKDMEKTAAGNPLKGSPAAVLHRVSSPICLKDRANYFFTIL